jgi:hypothetical protein
MVDCPFWNPDGSCRHVNEAVGAVVKIPESSCGFCVKTYQIDDRKASSKVVASFIVHGKRAQGIPTTLPAILQPAKTPATNPHQFKRPTACEYLGKVVKRVSCNCPKKHAYECNRFKDDAGTRLVVIPAAQCETCPAYINSEV